MYQFDVIDATNKCVAWIKAFFEENGPTCNAIVGISGGKDSSVVAGLCVKALGRDRVIGILMPNGTQQDISDSYQLCKHLGIKYYEVNIGSTTKALKDELQKHLTLSNQTIVNMPPRLRMTTLYAMGQSLNGRVANTCNYSEDYVGYSTRYGDSVGDFSPISCFTVTEVLQIGDYIGLPKELVHKTPSDGLCGKTDEDNLGFTYHELDLYIREGIAPTQAKQERIDYLHRTNLFKLSLMPSFKYEVK